MRSYQSHKRNQAILLEMIEKGRLISRQQAARFFHCSEKTITARLNELKEEGNDIHYSRSVKKFILKSRKK